jgi:hypothetical protein
VQVEQNMNLFLRINDIKTGTQKTYTMRGKNISVLAMPKNHLTSSTIYNGELSGSAKCINNKPGTVRIPIDPATYSELNPATSSRAVPVGLWARRPSPVAL